MSDMQINRLLAEMRALAAQAGVRPDGGTETPAAGGPTSARC